MKKRRKPRANANGSAELKEEETSLGTGLNLGSKADVGLDLGLQERETLSSKGAHLETEHLTRLRSKRKRKENSLIGESNVNVSLVSGLKEEVNSSVRDTLMERDSHLGTLDNIRSDSGLQSQLNEQPADSERKRKRKKDPKIALGGQFGEEGPKSVVELRHGKENSITDENQSCARVESMVNVSLESVEKSSLEPELKESQLNEQPADSERKRTRKRKCKMAKAGQFEKLDQKFAVELRDGEVNSVIDEMQSDSWVKPKLNVSSESGLKDRGNLFMKDSLWERDLSLETLNKISLGYVSKGSQLNEQLVDPKRKRKRKRRVKVAKPKQFENMDVKYDLELRDRKEDNLIDEKQSDSHVELKMNVSSESGLMEKANPDVETPENISLDSGLKGTQLNEQTVQSERKGKRKRKKGKKEMRRLNVLEVIDISSEAQNNIMCPVTQITNRKEDVVSISENLELKILKENFLIPDKQNDSPQTANTGIMKTQDLRTERDLVIPEVKDNKTFQKGKMVKTYYRKRKKSYGLVGNAMEPVQENGMIQTSIDHLEKEHATGISESRPDRVLLGEHAMPAQLLEEAFGNSTGSEAAPKRRRKRRGKKLKEILKYPDQKDAEIETNTEGHIPSSSNLAVAKEDVALTVTVKENNLAVKTYYRKRKKSSGLVVNTIEPVQENGMIQTSIDHLEKEHATGISESRPDGVPLGEHAMPVQLLEEAFGNSTCNEAAPKRRRKRRGKKLKEILKYPDQKDVEIETNMEEHIPSSSNLAVAKDDVALTVTVKENNLSPTLHPSLERICFSCPKKKLLVLDLNGILVDVVKNPGEYKPNVIVSKKGVFRRPFCDDFFDFCFRTFNVGIWSSRINKNVKRLVDFLMMKWRRNLLFCWHRRQCTITKFKTLEEKKKPLVLKELGKLWASPNVPWEKGVYDESNTLLLDDSPYKALRNPANTAVFPYPYHYRDAKDSSLGPGGDIRTYLEGLAAAENVQKYVDQNPFGQPAITESHPDWDFYCQIIDSLN